MAFLMDQMPLASSSTKPKSSRNAQSQARRLVVTLKYRSVADDPPGKSESMDLESTESDSEESEAIERAHSSEASEYHPSPVSHLSSPILSWDDSEGNASPPPSPSTSPEDITQGPLDTPEHMTIEEIYELLNEANDSPEFYRAVELLTQSLKAQFAEEIERDRISNITLKEENAVLTADLTKMTARLEAEKITWQARVTQLEGENKTLMAQQELYHSENLRLTKQLEGQASQDANRTSSIQDAATDSENEKGTMKQLREQLDILRHEHQQVAEKLKLLTDENERLTREKADIETKRQSLLESMTREVAESKRNLEQHSTIWSIYSDIESGHTEHVPNDDEGEHEFLTPEQIKREVLGPDWQTFDVKVQDHLKDERLNKSSPSKSRRADSRKDHHACQDDLHRRTQQMISYKVRWEKLQKQHEGLQRLLNESTQLFTVHLSAPNGGQAGNVNWQLQYAQTAQKLASFTGQVYVKDRQIKELEEKLQRQQNLYDQLRNKYAALKRTSDHAADQPSKNHSGNFLSRYRPSPRE